MDIVKTLQILFQNLHVGIKQNSNKSQIKQGVPQGGICSPALFNRYINDLAQELTKIADTYYFADDLAVIVPKKRTAKKVIETVENWSCRNAMSTNKQKCGIIRWSKHRKELSKQLKNQYLLGIPYVN